MTHSIAFSSTQKNNLANQWSLLLLIILFFSCDSPTENTLNISAIPNAHTITAKDSFYFDTIFFNSLNIQLIRKNWSEMFKPVNLKLIKDSLQIFEYESNRFYPYHAFVYDSKKGSFSFDTIISVNNKILFFTNWYNNQKIYIIDSVKTQSIETDFAFCIVLKNEKMIFYSTGSKDNIEENYVAPIIGLNLVNNKQIELNHLTTDNLWEYSSFIENKEGVNEFLKLAQDFRKLSKQK